MSRKGQSLVSVLIAIGIGSLIITAAVGAISLAVKSNRINTTNLQGVPIAREISEKLKVISESEWNSIYLLEKKGSGFDYYIPEDFEIVRGHEGVAGDDIRGALVGYWKLDESTGDIANDSSRGDNNGTLSPAAPNGPGKLPDSSCWAGGCFNFDGTDDYISLSGPTNTNNAFTWAARIYPTNVTKDQMFMGGNLSGVSNAFYFRLYQSRLFVSIHTGAQQTLQAPSSSALANGKFYFVSAVYDGSTLRLYQDGEEVASSTLNATLSTWGIGRIGRWTDSDQRSFVGRIDDVRIYNRALTEKEIEQLYDSRAYSRHFIIENVCRDSGGNIIGVTDNASGTGKDGSTTTCNVAPSGTHDPTTQKATVNVTWNGGSYESVQYLRRLNNDSVHQDDWSSPSNYTSSNGVDTTGGSIRITPVE